MDTTKKINDFFKPRSQTTSKDISANEKVTSKKRKTSDVDLNENEKSLNNSNQISEKNNEINLTISPRLYSFIHP